MGDDLNLPILTRTEARLLELVAAGRALTAAGAELALSPSAVASAVVDLRERFGVASTAAVVTAAHAAGVLDLDLARERDRQR